MFHAKGHIFSYIMAKRRHFCDDGDVHFALNQQAEKKNYSASSLKQQSFHLDTNTVSGRTSFWSYSLFLRAYQRSSKCQFYSLWFDTTGYHIVLENTIHLLHAGEGNMKIYSPKSIIFPEGIARGKYTRG